MKQFDKEEYLLNKLKEEYESYYLGSLELRRVYIHSVVILEEALCDLYDYTEEDIEVLEAEWRKELREE